MIRNPKDLQRYDAQERANHWLVGICFILLALSGLAFFHPAFYPLTQLFGGGVWARILHPFIGVLMAAAFLVMFFRFRSLNTITPADKEWLSRVGEMMSARIGFPGPAAVRDRISMIGRQKARVLPVPVLALPARRKV